MRKVKGDECRCSQWKAPDDFMREIKDHQINELNERLKIVVTDGPGPGGANHDYDIQLVLDQTATMTWDIHFQKGTVKEAGFNGLTNEALIAVVIDRCRGFQSGEFANRETALALTKLEEALMWLQKRTRDRIARGVEGTYQK